MGPFRPTMYQPSWLTDSAKKKQVAKSPDGKMPTPDSKLSQSVSVSVKKKKKNKGKKKSKAHKLQEGDLADGEQASDVSGFAKAQSPTLSIKDETFVTVEEMDPQEEEMVRIKKEPMSPTLPKATVFQEAVAPEGSVADEHFSTPLQSPVPTKSELTKENAPLRSESRVSLSRYPPYEHAKRSASPSPSSQLHVENHPTALVSLVNNFENPTALMSLLNNISAGKGKSSTMKARSPQKLQKSTPVPNSTLDQNFPPTSPLNSKTPGPMPRMMQFDSSPNHFSPSKSNKCTPVPLPKIKGFPPGPRLGTPFKAEAGAEADPLTPADVEEILNRAMSKNDSGDEHGDTVMHDAEEHVAVSPAAGTRGVANGEESDVEMTTIIKDEQHDNSVADGPVKKSKKSKKSKKRRIEESNALDDDETITASAPKKAKKTKKKKAKKVSVEQEHEITMDLDGMTQVDDTMQIDDTTQVELDKQLNETEHGGASETVSAPKNVEELTAEHEVTEIVDEPASTVKKKKVKKSRKAKQTQDKVEDHQVIEMDEVVAPVVYVADPEQSTKADQVTEAAAATEFSPTPKAKVTKKGRKTKEVSTEPKPEEPGPEQEDTDATITASNVAATMTTNPLLAIAKQVVKFDNNLSFHSETFQGELSTIKQNLAALDQRIQANELRASYRHQILFNALTKLSMDVNKLSASSSPAISGTSQADHQNDRSNSPGSSPASADRDRLARSVRATTVGPKGYVQSVTPIPLPKLGKMAFSSHHREMPASGAGAGAKAAGAAGISGAAIAEARKNQDKLLKGFTKEMDAAKDKKTVEIKGALCVKYADDLFKML